MASFNNFRCCFPGSAKAPLQSAGSTTSLVFFFSIFCFFFSYAKCDQHGKVTILTGIPFVSPLATKIFIFPDDDVGSNRWTEKHEKELYDYIANVEKQEDEEKAKQQMTSAAQSTNDSFPNTNEAVTPISESKEQITKLSKEELDTTTLQQLYKV
eukprot:GHVS01035240.1.p2 GENE.GHVS01035240.1~~GHVS01035240.1.p2  ORF type:complete len:155 (-),score=25.45 GHVS01035240.1:1459-1923(-)